MRSFVVLSFLLVGVFSGCKENTPVQSDPSSMPFTISGTIQSWKLGDTVEINFVRYSLLLPSKKETTITYGSSTVSNTGAFTITFNEPPTPFLSQYVPPFRRMSDTSARVAEFVQPQLYSNGKMVGYTYLSELSKTDTSFPGMQFGYYMYATKNVTVTSADTYRDGASLSIFVENMNLVKGWNFIIQQKVIESPVKTTFTTTQQNHSTLNWYYTKTFYPHIPSRIHR